MTRQFRIASVMLGSALVAGAIIAGVAWMPRGPDPAFLPDMIGPISVDTDRSVWVQKYQVTVAEWNACHDSGGCALQIVVRSDQQPATTPATGISHPDAQQYIDWLNHETGGAYRLPGVAEWTEVAQGVLPDKPEPLFTDPSLRWASAYMVEASIPRALKPSGSFSTTDDGVSDLGGSVWEWTQDCYAGTGEPLTPDRCPAFYVAGLHIAAMSFLERDPARGGCAVGVPPAHLGLRLFSDVAS
ncbi:SUMF1/EgtB/PvdO family nonheme iron enzyme [Oceaniovalibus sp. ACAM 378]|uniref:formylglycine-generating enzyme family protein n=1 Tax=Oceaniovalibus sp. ACAM 378 TaxID=2599923 RepID=UPI001652A94B|nr:SUMF1/EgtB/PvdO family nonheme iron enzyme [Oceaniovalibus sp. ACAM 378]